MFNYNRGYTGGLGYRFAPPLYRSVPLAGYYSNYSTTVPKVNNQYKVTKAKVTAPAYTPYVPKYTAPLPQYTPTYTGYTGLYGVNPYLNRYGGYAGLGGYRPRYGYCQNQVKPVACGYKNVVQQPPLYLTQQQSPYKDDDFNIKAVQSIIVQPGELAKMQNM